MHGRVSAGALLLTARWPGAPAASSPPSAGAAAAALASAAPSGAAARSHLAVLRFPAAGLRLTEDFLTSFSAPSAPSAPPAPEEEAFFDLPELFFRRASPGSDASPTALPSETLCLILLPEDLLALEARGGAAAGGTSPGIGAATSAINTRLQEALG